MKDAHDSLANTGGKEYSIMNMVSGCISAAVHLIVMNNLLNSIYWASVPPTPYYLKKRIKFLETKLIEQLCYTNEEIIRP